MDVASNTHVCLKCFLKSRHALFGSNTHIQFLATYMFVKTMQELLQMSGLFVGVFRPQI